MTRPEASTQLLTLGGALTGLAGAHLTEAARALAMGSPEVRANVARSIKRVALTLRIAGGEAADGYGQAAQICAEVGT